MKSSLQLWSIRDAIAEDFAGTLKKVAEMGYQGVEFAGYFGHTAAEVKALLVENGLEVSGSHVPFDKLTDDLAATLAFEKEIGNTHIIVPHLDFDSVEAWRDAFVQLEKIGQQVEAAGFTFDYHNHGHEFLKFPGFDLLDEMYQATSHVDFEVDAYWVAYGQKDVLAWLAAHAEKVVTLHMKDMEIVDGAAYSCVLGTGMLPLRAYAEYAAAHDFKWLVVEQEAFLETAPLPAAALNATYLNQLIVEVEQ